MTTITKSIIVHPDKLDSSIGKYVKNKVVQLSKICSKTYGYVNEITSPIKILSNTIIEDGFVEFVVQYKANIYKPKSGDILSCQVCLILDLGIFVIYQDKFKILIPEGKLKDAGYKLVQDRYVKKKKSIDKDDNINVKINMVRYNNNTFDCIGELA